MICGGKDKDTAEKSFRDLVEKLLANISTLENMSNVFVIRVTTGSQFQTVLKEEIGALFVTPQGAKKQFVSILGQTE